jgi:hypothetical protein
MSMNATVTGNREEVFMDPFWSNLRASVRLSGTHGAARCGVLFGTGK